MSRENVEANSRFIEFHEGLLKQGKIITEIRAAALVEFQIDNHTYRAWRSRLKLQYGNRYTERILPFMDTPSTKKTTGCQIEPVIEPVVVVTLESHEAGLAV